MVVSMIMDNFKRIYLRTLGSPRPFLIDTVPSKTSGDDRSCQERRSSNSNRRRENSVHDHGQL